jgi:galectin-8/galectin-9
MLQCFVFSLQIAVNGQHYTEFCHRIPYQRVTCLAIDGDVTISLIQYEGGSSVPGTGVGFVPPPMAPVPPPPVPGLVPYPTNPTTYPTVPGAVPYSAPGGYGYQPGYGQGYPTGNYPVSHQFHVLIEFLKVQ